MHDEDCPRVTVGEDLTGSSYEVYDCPVGRHIDYWGFDDLTDWEGNEVNPLELDRGEYPLHLSWTVPSMFEDAEVEFTIRLSA